MIGDDRKRYCGDCKLNVYNLSGMSRGEAENLILNAEGRLCVRFYKRADGSILTKDCPVGWQAVKRRISRTAAAMFSLLVGLIGGLGFVSALSPIKKSRILPVLMGDVAVERDTRTMGVMVNTGEPTMGNIAVPTPKPKNDEYTVGKLAPVKN